MRSLYLKKGITTMDETTYYTWWALHLRTTRGKHLNSEEQSTYEAGLRQLQQEETGDQDILTLQQTRTTVAALENVITIGCLYCNPYHPHQI